MQATYTALSEEIISPAPQPFLEVSLAYQDLMTGLSARKFLYDVLNHCEMQVEFSLTLWNLALFHLPEIREQAVLNACEANVVLVSLRGDSGLEPETESWLTEWIARRGADECALAVLIGCDAQRLDLIGQTLLWLQHVTRPTEVRLFVGFMPAGILEEVSHAKEAPLESTTIPFATPDIYGRVDAHSEGGLNE